MTNREKFKETFNKDIYWSRAIEPQMLALKSAHIDGIDCMEEWLNSEYESQEFERAPIGYLIITKYLRLAIYKPINRFRRFMMKLCFGWTYEPYQKGGKDEVN